MSYNHAKLILTPRREKQLRELHAQGMTCNTIAKRMLTNPKVMKRWHEELGLPLNAYTPPKKPKVDRKQLAEEKARALFPQIRLLHDQGETRTAIRMLTGATQTGVTLFYEETGLTPNASNFGAESDRPVAPSPKDIPWDFTGDNVETVERRIPPRGKRLVDLDRF